MSAGDSANLQALMIQAQAGDQPAYSQLLALARPMIYRYLFRRIRDVSTSDDICQDVLLRMHAFRHTYDQKQKFEPWMFTITRNALVDHFRAAGRRNAIIDLQEEVPFDIGEQPEAATKLEMEQALDQLSEDQKQTLTMVKIEGKTMEEVAETTGASVAAVKVRAHRAYKAFFTALRGEKSQKGRLGDKNTSKKAS